MKIADDRHVDAQPVEAIDDGGDRLSRVIIIDRDTNQLGARPRQRRHLADGGFNVSRVGIGHGLHHNWCIATDAHPSDCGRIGLSAL